MRLCYTTLLFNAITLAVTAAAVIKRPILSYKLIALLALCATSLALHQVATGRANAFTLWVTALLVVVMTGRIASNLHGATRQKRH